MRDFNMGEQARFIFLFVGFAFFVSGEAIKLQQQSCSNKTKTVGCDDLQNYFYYGL